VERELTAWDVSSGETIFQRKGQFDPSTLAISPDGQRLGAVEFELRQEPEEGKKATPNWVVKVWDLGNPGKEPSLIKTAEKSLQHLTFSPNGSRLAAVVPVGSRTTSLPAFPPPPSGALGAPGGVLSVRLQSQVDYKILIWDTAAGQVRGDTTVRGAMGNIAFSPDGTRLAAIQASDGGDNLGRNIYLWSGAADDKLTLLWSRVVLVKFGVGHLAFSPDGRSLAISGLLSQVVQLLDPDSGAERQVVKAPAGFHLFSFSADGARLITVGSSVLMEWDVLRDSAPAAPVPLAEEITVRSRDGERQAVYRRGGFGPPQQNFEGPPPEISVRDRAGKEIYVFRKHTSGAINGVQFSPDGQLVMSRTTLGEARIWETDTGKVQWQYDIDPPKDLRDIRDRLRLGRLIRVHAQTSPDGRLLALVTANGMKIVHFDGLKDFLTAEKATHVYFSPDTRRLVTVRAPETAKESNNTGEMQLWNLETGQLIRSEPIGPASVVFNADHRLFLTATLEGKSKTPLVGVWNLETGEKVSAMKGGFETGGNILSFSPVFSRDGARVVLASGSGAISSALVLTVHEVATGKELAHIYGPSADVTIAFSPDGKRIAAAGNVRLTGGIQVQMWDAASGRELLNLKARRGVGGPSSRRLSFSPDGHRLTLTWRFLRASTATETTWDATPRAEK
jgi:WD40 repeat protein